MPNQPALARILPRAGPKTARHNSLRPAGPAAARSELLGISAAAPTGTAGRAFRGRICIGQDRGRRRPRMTSGSRALCRTARPLVPDAKPRRPRRHQPVGVKSASPGRNSPRPAGRRAAAVSAPSVSRIADTSTGVVMTGFEWRWGQPRRRSAGVPGSGRATPAIQCHWGCVLIEMPDPFPRE
jgi:hypothetical protein